MPLLCWCFGIPLTLIWAPTYIRSVNDIIYNATVESESRQLHRVHHISLGCHVHVHVRGICDPYSCVGHVLRPLPAPPKTARTPIVPELTSKQSAPCPTISRAVFVALARAHIREHVQYTFLARTTRVLQYMLQILCARQTNDLWGMCRSRANLLVCSRANGANMCARALTTRQREEVRASECVDSAVNHLHVHVPGNPGPRRSICAALVPGEDTALGSHLAATFLAVVWLSAGVYKYTARRRVDDISVARWNSNNARAAQHRRNVRHARTLARHTISGRQ